MSIDEDPYEELGEFKKVEDDEIVEEGYLSTHRYETNVNGVRLTYRDALQLAEVIAGSLPAEFTDKVNFRIETDNTEISLDNEEDFKHVVAKFDELQKPKSITMSVFSYSRKYVSRKAEIYVVVGRTLTRISVSGTNQEWVLETAQTLRAFMKERDNLRRHALWPVMITITTAVSLLIAFLMAIMTHDPALAGFGFVIGFLLSGLFHNSYTLKKFTYNSLDFSDVKNIAQKDAGAVG